MIIFLYLFQSFNRHNSETLRVSSLAPPCHIRLRGQAFPHPQAGASGY